MHERQIDGEWAVVGLGAALAVAAWWIHSLLLACVGTLGALTALALWVWQRECLSGVSYRRTLTEHRATFGDEVHLDIEVVNDKLLPLTWLHIEDLVPPSLTIQGGTVLTGSFDSTATLHQLFPMLPYQRTRRRLTVVCDRRGLHRFGPGRMESGNPLGYRPARREIRHAEQLLVYPKVFPLTWTGPASRVPLGDHRAQLRLIGDPSRMIGVREYQPGDPLRHVDWRATARSDSLRVRLFEPTASPRVAVFADLAVPQLSWRERYCPELEFTVSVTASVIAELAARRVPVGLYAAALVNGHRVARVPGSAPDALPEMLELLARATPYGARDFADFLATAGGPLPQGTTIVVVAANYPPRTSVALAELRRRHAVTVVWVATGQGTTARGAPPDREVADTRWEVAYDPEWISLPALELAS